MHFPWNVNRSYLVKCAREAAAATTTTRRTTTTSSILNKRGVACNRRKAHGGCFEVNVQLQQRARQHLLRLNVQLGAGEARQTRGVLENKRSRGGEGKRSSNFVFKLLFTHTDTHSCSSEATASVHLFCCCLNNNNNKTYTYAYKYTYVTYVCVCVHKKQNKQQRMQRS